MMKFDGPLGYASIAFVLWWRQVIDIVQKFWKLLVFYLHFLFISKNISYVDSKIHICWCCIENADSVSIFYLNIDLSNEFMNPIVFLFQLHSMRTATSKFVTVLDVIVVVGACLSGGVTGLIAKKFIQRINENLKKVNIIANNWFFPFWRNNSIVLGWRRAGHIQWTAKR